jgi:hypothetical protein
LMLCGTVADSYSTNLNDDSCTLVTEQRQPKHYLIHRMGYARE